jgi:hypothetical protein
MTMPKNADHIILNTSTTRPWRLSDFVLAFTARLSIMALLVTIMVETFAQNSARRAHQGFVTSIANAEPAGSFSFPGDSP